MHAGETIVVRIKAAEHGGGVPRDGHGTAELWAPGKDPRRDAGIREHPDKVFECFWDERDRAWVAQVSTDGWEPGTWTCRARCHVTGTRGPAKGWAWALVPLEA